VRLQVIRFGSMKKVNRTVSIGSSRGKEASSTRLHFHMCESRRRRCSVARERGRGRWDSQAGWAKSSFGPDCCSYKQSRYGWADKEQFGQNEFGLPELFFSNFGLRK
jgi:hypothetical protein